MRLNIFSFVAVQLLSCVQLFVTPWTIAHQASLSSTILWSLLNFMSTDSAMLSKHLIVCHPLLLLPSIFPNIRVVSNESALHLRCPKYRGFNCSISPSNEYLGLVSSRIDRFDLLVVQRSLKSLLQHNNSKASVLPYSAFFIMAHLSHLYMTTGKATALTILTFVGKVIPLLFNMLSRLILAFLPRRKRLYLCSACGHHPK